MCGGAASPLAGGLSECGSCGLVFRTDKYFGAPTYKPGLEEDIYGSAKAALFREALDRLDRSFPTRGRLLDIGCAGGELLAAAAARGWLAAGVEVDAGLAAKALSRGFEVHLKPVEEVRLEGGSFDAVTVFDVFALMGNPPAAVAELLRLLKPGGIIYIREFNAAFHLAFYRLERAGFFKLLGASPSVIHNFNFSAITLRTMLARSGFREIKIRNSRPTSGDPYRTGGLLGGFLTGALKVLYYWLAQAVWLITFGRVYAGSALTVTAKK